jgi:hypothetical protein
MQLIKFPDDQVVKRLRWVMIGAMLFSIVNTLSGQPESFWRNPETAIRGDGLSIHNATNHTFDFFLGQGWQAYLIASLIYLLALFLIVSMLPRRAALTTMIAVVFAHFFGACNWLAVRWHLGMTAPTLYSLVLGPMIVFAAFPTASPNSDRILRRLLWVMVGVILLDMFNTLLGQPTSYWLHPETLNESNMIARFFMTRGWYAYLFMNLIYISVAFLLGSMLPRMWALICVFCFILVGFIGGSNWFFFHWRMGMEAPVIYGILLSAIIVWASFSECEETDTAPSVALDAAATPLRDLV